MWIIFVFLKKVIFYYQSNSPGKMPALLNDQKKDFFTRQTKKQENWKLDTKIFFLNLIIKMMFESTVVRLTPLSVPGWRRQASSPWGWLAAGHDWLEGCHRLATVGSGFWAGVTTWGDRVKREESKCEIKIWNAWFWANVAFYKLFILSWEQIFQIFFRLLRDNFFQLS